MGGDREWETWHGVNGQEYARRLKSSPPVVLRAPIEAELGHQMALADVLCPRGDYWRQVLAERAADTQERQETT